MSERKETPAEAIDRHRRAQIRILDVAVVVFAALLVVFVVGVVVILAVHW